tara:strand:- start:4881 stop:7079 length:2199 start_codon:yes stop_codon:yes gene_type:complete
MFRRKFIDRLRKKYESGGVSPIPMKSIQKLPIYSKTSGLDISSPRGYDRDVDYTARESMKDWQIQNGYASQFDTFNVPSGSAFVSGSKHQEGGMYNQMKQYQTGGKRGEFNSGKDVYTAKEWDNMSTLDRNRALGKNSGGRAGNYEGIIVSEPEYINVKQTGGMALPGGNMQPIPGSDAVQFNGQSHDQGGIMIDGQTEVEGGETMDQVTMAKNGGKRSDYFFSDHLKEGGVSYANMHKEILAEGGEQEKIDWLAQMQERAAGRSPGKIQTAESGGVKKYNNGGSSVSNQSGINNNTQNRYENQYQEVPETVNFVQDLTGKPIYNEYSNNEFVIDPNDLNTDADAAENFLNNFFKSREDQRIKENKKTEEVITENPVINKIVPNKKVTNKKKTTPVVSNTRVPTNETMLKIDPLMPEGWGTLSEEELLKRRTNTAENNTPTPEQQEEIIRKEGTPESNALLEKLKEKARRGDIPPEAYIAGIAQLLPAAYSFLHKQPDAEQGSYTPGFTSPIVAERGKASKLERVNYNNERATNASDMRGINKFIETSGGGPANIINKMAAYSRKQQGDSKINAAETRANMQISNQEAQMEQQMSINNMSRAQQASAQNAQMISAESARMDQINANNAAARQKLKDDEEAMKYQGISATASGIGGLLGDALSYKAGERMAKAIGSEGIYDRDRLRTVVSKYAEKNGIPGICPEPGTCTEADINTYITSENKTKEEPKEETKK